MFFKYMLKQEALLRRALKEKRINPKKLEIKIDHVSGHNWVNGVKTGIIYPDSFFLKSSDINTEKKYDFYFNGNLSETGGRVELLSPFIKIGNTKIVESNFGRSRFFKSYYNQNYFNGLASSKYGLCPHQLDWTGPKSTMWTYRFIECCFVGAIPVLFKKTPLGEQFIDGFKYYYDNDFLSGGNFPIISPDDVSINRLIAKERFLLNKDLIKSIRETV